jgi:hypothetical protein
MILLIKSPLEPIWLVNMEWKCLIKASVDVKRGKAVVEEEAKKLASKKKPPNGRGSTLKEVSANRTCWREKAVPSSSHLGNAPLPKAKWKEKMSNKIGNGKEDDAKGKGKILAYKLQSDIESSIDMKGIIEKRILDAKIELTLREALGIAKKDFHKLIFYIIKRRRQMAAEIVMARALDTRTTKDKEVEIGQVFALMCDCVDGQDKKSENISA